MSINLAQRMNAVDAPDGSRKLQDTAIPRLGGVGVATAYFLASLIVLTILGEWWQARLALAIVLPALIASLIGLADDARHLSPRLRLVLQACVGMLAFGLGTQANLTPFWLANLFVTILWVMIIINGINLLDNSDGLAASTVSIAAATSMVIALLLGQVLIALLAASLIGVSAGFLMLNWHPARVYLGDGGAYFLGTILALLVVRIRPAELPVGAALLVAMLVVALPLVDTAYVVVNRLRRGIHPFTAGRDHLSHRLHRLGASIPASVLTLQVLALICGVTAVLIVASL